MSEAPLELFQIIEKLRSGEGVLLGGGQNQWEVNALVSALPEAARHVLDRANQDHYALVAHAARNTKPGFLLHQTPPTLRISVSEWIPGEVSLQQDPSPTTKKGWNAYRVQARAVMPDAHSRAAKTKTAQELADEEQAHARVSAFFDIPFDVGIDVHRHGVGGYVSSDLPLGMIPPVIIAQVALAPEHPSMPDFYNVGIALVSHEGPPDDLNEIIGSPGYGDFPFHLKEAVEMAQLTLGIGDGTSRDNPPFIGDHNRERLFGGLHTPPTANDPAVDWLRNQLHQSLGR
jgi:hypothetical protein